MDKRQKNNLMTTMKIISDLSKICSGTVILCKANEVTIPAYVVNNFNDIYYLYVQNRIMAIEIQLLYYYLTIHYSL